jgi:6-pyruvoyltetrahydropterin/6-carboxytetrahydropterin synthase
MSAELEGESMKIVLERRYRFSASHLYRRPDWSEAENRARFGKCANLPGHGHNYHLWIGVQGEIDPATGFVIDLGQLDGLLRDKVIERLDHQHLNSALPEFAAGGAIPTSESLVRWIHEQLAGCLPSGARLVRIRLAEDEDLAAEWSEEQP